MQNSDTIKAALLLALGPYVHERIKLYYERERDRRFQQDGNNDGNNDSNNNNNNNNNNNSNNNSNNQQRQQRQNNHGILQKLQSLFIYIYPFLHMSNEGIKIAYSFTYMIGKSIYYSPSLHALNQIVRRLTINDMNMNMNTNTNMDVTSQGSAGIGNKKNLTSKDKKATTTTTTTKTIAALEYLKGPAAAALVLALSIGWMGQLRQELRNRRRRLLHNTRQRQRQNDLDRNHASVGIRGNATNTSNTSITRNALPIPVRNRSTGGNNENNVQGHNSDGNSESDGNSNSSSMTNIPPPLPPSVNVQSEIILPTNPSLCPLCNQERVNPVASTSGYVFCYRCLALYIRDKGEVCPVTGQRCKESQLTRIYESMDVITNRR
jgi:hypothetical protein